MAGFSVVAMMRETPDVVQRFVDYYEALGATEVFVYFNGPAEELPPIRGATRTNLDAAFWARNPDITLETIEDRMRVCYRDCLPRCRTPWLLVVDADEFVFADRPLTALLDGVPESVDAISFPTAEAVWGPGDDPDQPFGSTYFRTKWPSELQWRLLRRPIYGAVSSVMRWGVLGHVAGKHMVRTDRQDISIGCHRSMRGTESVTQPAAGASKAFAHAYVAHFDAIGLDRWERKWRGRIEKEVVAGGLSRMRQEQMEMVAAALKSGRTRALFRSFYGLSRGQSLVLSGLGHVFRREHFFDRAADYAAEPVRVPQSLRSKATLS
jgi:Glycosyl transferase family 2